MITHLTSDQLSLTREIAHSFFKDSKLPGEFNWKHWLDCWSALLDKQMAKLIVSMDNGKIKGVIGGIVFHCLNTGDLEILEAFWYVFPEHRGGTVGIRLLQEFEKWGREMGAKRVKMVHLTEVNGDTMAGIYNRLGYIEQEVCYRKELT